MKVKAIIITTDLETLNIITECACGKLTTYPFSPTVDIRDTLQQRIGKLLESSTAYAGHTTESIEDELEGFK